MLAATLGGAALAIAPVLPAASLPAASLSATPLSAAPLSATPLSATHAGGVGGSAEGAREGAAELRDHVAIELHENERLALFLFAFHAARSLSDEPLADRLDLSAEDMRELAAQRAAFAPLAAAFAPYLDKHPMFDRTLFFTGAALAGAPVPFPDGELKAALDRFMPIYRARFAPRHRELTGIMRRHLQAQLRRHGERMAQAVARELSSGWREEPIRLDLVPYATRLGAYTNSYHTVFSATDPDFFDHALEMAFHEAAHTGAMFDNLRVVARKALEAHGLSEPRFWHYLQFYGVGRAAQSVLGPGHAPYHVATGLSSRTGTEYYQAIDEVWDAHETLAARAHAAAALVASRKAR